MSDTELIVEDLIQLGYSEYEARVYIGLLENPEVSGYQASKQAQVPRSKVYEVLDGLVSRGVVLEMSVDGKTLYRPLPYEALIQKHKEKTEKRLYRLQQNLGKLPVEKEEHHFFSLTGRKSVIAKAREMIESAEKAVFVSLWPQEHSNLEDSIAAARMRGITAASVIYENTGDGPGRTGEHPIFYHTVTPMQHKQVEMIGRWMMLSVDGTEAVIAQFDEGEQVALCSRNRLMAFLIAQTVTHDILFMEYYRALGDEATRNLLDEDTEQMLQRIQRAASLIEES